MNIEEIMNKKIEANILFNAANALIEKYTNLCGDIAEATNTDQLVKYRMDILMTCASLDAIKTKVPDYFEKEFAEKFTLILERAIENVKSTYACIIVTLRKYEMMEA